MQAKKFYGQHFLRDRSVVEAILAASDLEPETAVLEIGPGEGVLTERLVERGAPVVAVDIDREAIETVREHVSAKCLTLVEQDILTVSAEQLQTWFPDGYVLVGNVPYNITSPIVNTFLNQDYPPVRAVLMVQKEVADRMMAGAGEMNMLALLVQLSATVERVVKVPRGAFFPPPKVDSAVVRLDLATQEDQHARGVRAPERLLLFARVAFAQKRKQLQSTLGTLPQTTSDEVKAVLQKLGHPETARPQELSVDNWIALYREINERAC